MIDDGSKQEYMTAETQMGKWRRVEKQAVYMI